MWVSKKIKLRLGKNHSKNFKIELQNVRNQVQIHRGLDYSTVCIYFKLTVSILIGQNVVRHVVLEHKLGRSRLMHKMMAKPVTKMTWREFAEWKNAKVRCRKFVIYFHLRTEHVNIEMSQPLSPDFFIEDSTHVIIKVMLQNVFLRN